MRSKRLLSRPTSRRTFLQGMVWTAAMTCLRWLTGCTRPTMPTIAPEATFPPNTVVPSLTPTLTPTLTPSVVPTSTPTPTPTPIPDAPLFSETDLTTVWIAHDPALQGYPIAPPFDPENIYPEHPYQTEGITPGNGAYRLVREALRLFNPEGYGTADWNPLGRLIRPGDRVLLKPNLVDASAWRNGQMTHPAFLRPIIDYVYKACGPSGYIMLGDAPWSVDVFDPLVRDTGIQAMVEYLVQNCGVPVVLQDLNKADREHTPLVDLGALSELRSESRVWYDAHGKPLLEEGEPSIGRYRIAPAVLEADVVVSIPKAKVHCSGGITVAMKNMVGIIPAWDGPYGDGVLKDCAHTSDVDQAAGRRGMYLDNDTIWRTMADLNRILLYADTGGVLQTTPQRRYLAIVDAIVAAEESQYDPHPYPLNTVIIGTDPISVDAITARCMGFDPRALKSVVKASARQELPLGTADPAKIKVHTSGGNTVSSLYRQALTPELYVYSWQGYLEASDFDPPEIAEWHWAAEGNALQITINDPSGVAWVRIAYTYAGENRMRALQLSAGTPQAGTWIVDFPLGAAVRQVTVLACDALFNEMAREISW
ncbi:MAG: DUF362 domain-containing protein [Anaerolineae bacterium]|nr:DUF362 domain-containing protein [Anaerolineae bacterium]